MWLTSFQGSAAEYRLFEITMSSLPQPSGQIAPAPSSSQSLQHDQTSGAVVQADPEIQLHCPFCQASCETGARFCIECGQALDDACPCCGHPAEGCDFCQACGHWLLNGQCRFCYAPLPDEAQFCEECGCNQQGLVCSHCGTKNFFDFCSCCGLPLSERAQAAVLAAPSDPALTSGLAELRETLSELARLESETPLAAPIPKGSLFSAAARLEMREAVQALVRRESLARQAEQASSEAERMAARKAVEAQRQEIAEQTARAASQTAIQSQRLSLSARLKAARERVRAIAEKSRDRRFPDAQSARCALMRERHQLAAEGHAPTHWRCHAFDVVHDNPNECGRPQDGGEWLFEDS
ncbi:hypothetical protein [Niveibacterium terrae]|uniref:zinc ribbon domain-containing protein n=1 Tax=Niveibacterium terrae TaxID=3373598 RepID=UPI003A905CE8